MILKDISPVFIEVDDSFLNSRNSAVFTSATGEQVSSWYRDKSHSLFTYYFLKGLQGEADLDSDGTIADMGAYYFHQTSGCTDEESCTYNEEAIIDDGSCLYNDCLGECGGSSVLDECNICGGNGIEDYSYCTDGVSLTAQMCCEENFGVWDGEECLFCPARRNGPQQKPHYTRPY